MKDMTAQQVEKELATLELEEKRLRVQVLREQVEKSNSLREAIMQRIRDQARLIFKNKLRREAEQKQCKHLKGGRGHREILRGNSSDSSIIKQTEPWGETYGLCQRCNKEVRQPFYMLRKTDSRAFVAAVKKMGKKAYEEAVKEYLEWMNKTTDNSPSGSTLFQYDDNKELAGI